MQEASAEQHCCFPSLVEAPRTWFNIASSHSHQVLRSSFMDLCYSTNRITTTITTTHNYQRTNQHVSILFESACSARSHPPFVGCRSKGSWQSGLCAPRQSTPSLPSRDQGSPPSFTLFKTL